LVLLEAGAADDRKLLADLQAIFGIDRPGLGVSAVPRLHAVTLVEAAGIEVLRIDGVRRRRKAVMRVLDVEHVDVDAHYKLVRQAVAQRGVELHMRLAAGLLHVMQDAEVVWSQNLACGGVEEIAFQVFPMAPRRQKDRTSA